MELSAKQIKRSLMLICMVFFVFGFATWINAMLIPYFKIACQLSNFESYLVTFAFYISYLVVAVPASFLLRRAGFKNGMAVGFMLMAAGAFIFIPAAYMRSYLLFLLGLFIIGIGLAILQTAVNPYVTILGAKERAAQRISIMGICNKTAGIIAPLLLAAVIIKPGDKTLLAQIPAMPSAPKNAALDMLVQRLIAPYAVVGCVLALLAMLVRFSSLPEIEQDDAEDARRAKASILKYPHVVLGAIAIFFHVGSQIIAIDTIVNYAQSWGATLAQARVFPSYTLFATICGYLLGISLIPNIISQLKALRICTILGVILSVLVVNVGGRVTWLGHDTDVSVWLLVSLGFANSMIWAGIWPLALDGLGNKLKTGASLLIMGLSGNAVLPLVYGAIADNQGLKMAYWVLLPCYLYLVFYAFYGYRLRRWARSV